jgi:hypothetical protein
VAEEGGCARLQCNPLTTIPSGSYGYGFLYKAKIPRCDITAKKGAKRANCEHVADLADRTEQVKNSRWVKLIFIRVLRNSQPMLGVLDAALLGGTKPHRGTLKCR